MMLVPLVAFQIAGIAGAFAKEQQRGFAFHGYFTPGERASSRELLRISGSQLLQRAPYFAFLINRDDARVNFDSPSPPLVKPVFLGGVGIHPAGGAKGRRVTAKLSFRVPDLRPGLYDVVTCDSRCKHEVKRLGPAALYVVAGGTERRLRSEIEDLYSELSRWENRVVRLAGRIPVQAKQRWPALLARVAALEKQVAGLQRQLDDTSQAQAFALPSGTLAVVGVLAAASLALLAGRHLRRSASGQGN